MQISSENVYFSRYYWLQRANVGFDVHGIHKIRQKATVVIGSEEMSIQAKNQTDGVVEWHFKHGKN